MFLDPSPRVMETKVKIYKCDLIKLISFCTAMETINKMKRQPTEWEKIFANGVTNRGILKIYQQPALSLLFSPWVVSDSLWPHGRQHARLPCPSLSPEVCSNSCPLSQWCYLTISSSAAPFSFCLQSFPASGSFPMSWLFTSSGQSTGASASRFMFLLCGLPVHMFCPFFFWISYLFLVDE